MGRLDSRNQVSTTIDPPDGFDRPGITTDRDGTTATFAYTTNTDNQDYVLTRAGRTITRHRSLPAGRRRPDSRDALNRDFHVSTKPSVCGESVVPRILDRGKPALRIVACHGRRPVPIPSGTRAA